MLEVAPCHLNTLLYIRFLALIEAEPSAVRDVMHGWKAQPSAVMMLRVGMGAAMTAAGRQRFNIRLAAWLAAAGLAGVLSLLLVPIENFAPETGLTVPVLRAVAIVQPAFLTVLLVIVGTALAPRVGLASPAVEAWMAGRPVFPVLRRQAGPAAITAIAVALILAAFALVIVPRLIRESGELALFADGGPPLLTRLLYGGITEELMTRWGLLTLFAWSAWRLAGRPARVAPWMFWTAILLSALLFAAGHLPLLFSLMVDPPSWAIAAVLLGNAVPGLAFGWLFWRYGLEAAMLAHGGAHLLSAPLALL